MKNKGIDIDLIHDTCYRNALRVYSQNTIMNENEWNIGIEYNQADLFEGNSILRGQHPKKSSLSTSICS